MESSDFLAISSPWQKLQNVVVRILICCHGNEIWAIFSKNSNCFFFFVFRWNRAIFWPLVLRDPSTKRCSSIFDLGHLSPKIDSPKFGQKSPITRLVWQIERRCLRLIGGFRGWLIEWNHTKCCRADPCCHGNEIWAKIAYNSTCTADRRKMFRPSEGFSGMADSMQPCKILYGWPLLPWQRNLGYFAKTSNCFFFFVFQWNRAIFWPLILHEPLYKTVFFDFWFRPLTPKIDSPKFGQKSPITRLVWQIDRRCLRLIGGFRRWPIQWNREKCCGPTLVAMATKIWQICASFSQKSILLFLFVDGIEPFWGHQFSM